MAPRHAHVLGSRLQQPLPNQTVRQLLSLASPSPAKEDVQYTEQISSQASFVTGIFQ